MPEGGDDERRTGAIGRRRRRRRRRRAQDRRGRTPATKEDGEIERRRGGDNQPTMTNGGEKGGSEGEPIATARVTQPAGNEACRRMGGDGEEEPETAATATAKET